MQKQKIELALYKKENLAIFSVSLLILLAILLSFVASYGVSALSLLKYNEEIKLIVVNERVEIKRYTGRGGVVFFFSKDGKHFEQFAIILMVHRHNILNYVMSILCLNISIVRNLPSLV